ncbi:S53 family peptidase [Nocardia sp. CDC160]|uniref:S53 family peptidase n=1 Tax=Nocardia sp. CDC160 TaxID=3112166 RepID=UPI002DBF52AF|nr:S53 family serine peptidase [Nocardia sp. CDC160]MEC3915681.1 S53 family serine peptidase [Nocardia sp. CDC160]
MWVLHNQRPAAASPRPRGRRSGLVGSAILAIAATCVGCAADAGKTESTVPVPSWIGHATDGGPTAPTEPIHGRIVLAGKDAPGRAAYAREVSTPDSDTYGKYLSPPDYRSRFGPTPEQTANIEAWLRNAGLTVGASDSHLIDFTGTAETVNRAFRTTLHQYTVAPITAVARTYTGTAPAPSSPLTIPSSLTGAVQSVDLTGASHEEQLQIKVPQKRNSNPAQKPAAPTPCSRYYGERTMNDLPPVNGSPPMVHGCGYSSAQLRGAYGVPAELTGQGQTVAIIGSGVWPSLESDVDGVFASTGVASLAPDQLRIMATENAPAEPSVEGAMDIEAVHFMAPAANLLYVQGDSTGAQQDSTLAGYTTVVDFGLADIITSSIASGPESFQSPGVVAAYENIFQQAAIEGITILKASSDFGSNNGDANFPDADPWVTAVGGTTLAVTADGGYRGETGWENTQTVLDPQKTGWESPPGQFVGGGGGGIANTPQPWYQRDVVDSALSRTGSGTPMRTYPDVAADADEHTGIPVGLTVDGNYRIAPVGGTSLASPLFAGMIADVLQQRGRPLGFANPALYRLAGGDAYHRISESMPGTDHPPAFATLDPAGPAVLVLSGQYAAAGVKPGQKYSTATGLGSPTKTLFAELTK